MSATSSPSTCSACGASAVTDGVCTRCGFASGSQHSCPHCGAVARVEPKGAGASLTWVCAVCGGPRMPNGLGGEKAAAPLREAKASQSAALRARATFWFFTMSTLFFTLVAVAAWPAALFVKLLLLAMAMGPAAIAVRARARASVATTAADAALDVAWLAAAEDVASHTKAGITVAELASRLKIDPVQAEHLLTQLAVHDRTRIDVGDDAEVRYSVAPGLDTSKVRISTSEDQFRALEQAEAEAAASQRPDTIGDRVLTAEEEALEAKRLVTSPFGRGPGR